MIDILILGRGFLGTNIYNSLRDEQKEVILLSKTDLDYTDYATLTKYLFEKKPAVVINASGYTGDPNIDAAEDDKETCWFYNVNVPVNIANCCLREQIPFIHLSSGCIYNGYEKEFTEEDIPNWGIYNSESSFYSKTKHAAELLLKDKAWLFRLRMPFNSESSNRNYFNKLLKYDKLINQINSVTCVDDLCTFIKNFIVKASEEDVPYGAFNVVNEGTLSARQVISLMKENNIKIGKHRFIKLEELRTKAKRSNCVLSTKKIKTLGLELPNAGHSAGQALSLFGRNDNE